MPIHILPARLANQIAAGEVVERPASVVKELVENSLDSAANHIDIEIDKGGHKRIVVRDNGSGIAHEELSLALSRHATSKISSLEDLEHIASLGFRGEALASISSVSRLTLSSKPAAQQDAWQAHCEGRDMEVQLNPVAHPDGTSVEVCDLFFNTPARRKFLRSEKTEFGHIDEVIRRIALSRFDVAFSLKHNGKLLRKYPIATSEASVHKRLMAICGKELGEQAIALNSQYDDFSLTGWLAAPDTARPQPDCQYFYVNGRMMRDKLLNHAVRQAFEGVIAPEHQLAYVLYFRLDSAQVDVNVHPAKHEVRFHQSRLVHDFVFRALTDALNQYFSQAPANSPQVQTLSPVEPRHQYVQPLRAEPMLGAPLRAAAINNDNKSGNHPEFHEHTENDLPLLAQRRPPQSSFSAAPLVRERSAGYQPGRRQDMATNVGLAGENYQQLMKSETKRATDNVSGWLKVNERQVLVRWCNDFYLLNIDCLLRYQLSKSLLEHVPVSQPLLLPVSIEADSSLLDSARRLQADLLTLSIDISWQGRRVILRKIPAGFRHYNWSLILQQLLAEPEQHDESQQDAERLTNILCACLAAQHPPLNDHQLELSWAEYCRAEATEVSQRLHHDAAPLPLTEWLQQYAQ